VSRQLRTGLFLVSALGLGALLVWGLVGLHSFGNYPGPYGDLISSLTKPQRHTANAVTAVVFDYRGFDTLGEELILFVSAGATAMLLRETREYDVSDIVDPVRSDATRAFGALAAIVLFVLGLNVVAHGALTPGGGFQGGVVLAAAFLTVFLAVEYHAFHRLAPAWFSEPLESVGVGSYLVYGLVALAIGGSYLENVLPYGTWGRLTSSGSIVLLSWASGLAVCGGFLVIFGEFAQENMAARHRRSK